MPAQLLDPKTLAPGLGELTQEMVKRYKAETKADHVPPHVSMGFNQTWIFLTDVLPRAIKKYGGIDPEALRKAALDTDIPDGGTIQGYGVKFFRRVTRWRGRTSAPRRWSCSTSTARPRSCGRRDCARPSRFCPGRRATATRTNAELEPQPRSPTAPTVDVWSVSRGALTKLSAASLRSTGSPSRSTQGEILGLIGPNGSGKSTTFNLIAGALRPTAGSIRFLGREIGGLPANRVAHCGIGRTFQIPRPFRRLSMLENVALAAYYGQAAPPVAREGLRQAQEALELVGLPADPAARVDGLGAAALKKLELARALATQPSCCSPTSRSAASTRRRWSRPPTCSRASATSAASPSSGSSTSWAR